MSTNCLVTKLKGAVVNPDLSKLGEIVITVTDAANFKINNTSVGQIIRANSAVLYYLDSNDNKVGEPFSEGVLYDGENHIYGVGVAAGFEGKVFVKFDYAAQDITLNGGNADFSSLTSIRSFRCQNTEHGTQITGFPTAEHQIIIEKCPANKDTNMDEFANIYDAGVTNLSISPSPGSVNFDVAALIANKPNIASLQIYRATLTGLTNKSMADFGKLAALTSITHINKYSWTVENFVANKRSAEVTSGSVNIIYGGDDSAGGVCSFNGQKLDSSVTEVTWTANTITYNGVTIDA